MTNQTAGLHHYHLRKRIHQKHEPFPHPDRFKRFYDKFIYIIVILAPIANIPQLVKIWVEKNASGVSPLSWFLFSWISVCWLIYGALHKDKPIWIMSTFLIVVQIMIAIGTLIYA